MLTEDQILLTLDNYKWGYYCHFIDLGAGYSYLIDSRLNIFRGDDDKWAIAAERLGYNQQAGAIMLDIYYFGNCLINLKSYNGQNTNYYTVLPIDLNNLNDTTINGLVLKKDAKYWIIRNSQIELSHNKQDYQNAGIELHEYRPGQISLEEVGRLLITKPRERKLLRATSEELYRSIPRHLKKLLVIDEWYHRDFTEILNPTITDEHLRTTYELNKSLAAGRDYMDFKTFTDLFRQQEQSNSNFNQTQWENNRPSSYETWQLLAKVIATGDIAFYRPTLKPNTHWTNWLDSGSL
jgi:hypothetical protein